MVQPKDRVISLIVYAVVLILIQNFVISTGLKPNQNIVWLFNGFASLLFGSRLLNPHFTPPADAATNSFVALSSLIAVSLVVTSGSPDAAVLWVISVFCGLVCLASILVLIFRTPVGIESRPLLLGIDKAVRGLGSPNFIFTIVILAAVWLFHRSHPSEVFAILTAWTFIVAIKPIEKSLAYASWIQEQSTGISGDSILGEIVAHQTPGIVLARQINHHSIPLGTPLVVLEKNEQQSLGVALNYVGRDEGNLLRVLTIPTSEKMADLVPVNSSFPTDMGIVLEPILTREALADIPEIQNSDNLCGIVDSDTILDCLQFEVIEDNDLFEGRLVKTRIKDETVLFQVIEGLTREEIVQHKNKYGYARAKARKIGRWDEKKEKFIPVKWIPHINTPVFLMNKEEEIANINSIGHFPCTPYGVGIDVSEAVTHNTAILGILGIGKSYLAIELVERMIARGIKVICLDLTNQYAELLADFTDPVYENTKQQELVQAGQGGQVHQNVEDGGSHQHFRSEVVKQLREFLDEKSGRFLRILNPAQFRVTRQDSRPYQGNAAMATLTPCEITAIISDAALEVCQELGMTDGGRVCLVYEEAHSLVPEWNSVVADGDKAATARSARAILQGRKFGLGCLLITQRTANVTKTILNQCNTIFAMRTFDDTGRDFLSNYIGEDYAKVLSSLEAQHAVVYGKASTCENPVLIRLNERDKFLEAFRAKNPPPQLPSQAIPGEDTDDEIPF